MTTNHLAKITIDFQRTQSGVQSVTFIHPRTGYQLQISPGPKGWMVHSSQGVRMEYYSENVYELLPERGGQVFELEKVENNDTS